MTSNPSTPISIRRNNFLSNCDSDVTVSRIPLPSPGSFRRSVSLRMRGSKGCLVSPTTVTLSSSIGERTTITTAKTMASTIETHLTRSSSSSTMKTPTLASSKTSPPLEHTSSVTDTFRPTTTTFADVTDCSITDTSSGITSDFQKISLNNCDFVEDLESTPEIRNSQQDGNSTTQQKRISESLTNMDNSGIIGENNVSPSSSPACCASANDKKPSPVSGVKRDPCGMSLNLNGPTTTTTNCPGSTARTPKTPHTPRTPSTSSGGGPSLGRTTPKTPPVTPDSPNIYLDDDIDSLYSYSSATSGRSTMSCEHPYVARNGTTFSGRKMKYVVHCSSYAGQVGEDYLTPTQRAQKQLRRLKELLTQARQDLERKDSEILRLTREVVELRLFKASLSSPEDRSNSSDAVTVREATTDLKTSQDVSPIVDMVDDITKSSPRHVLHSHGINQVQFLEKMSSSEMQSSFADSGHFEDMTTSSVHSKDSFIHTQDRACGSDNTTLEEQRQELIRMYEKRIEDLIQTQDCTTSEMKRTHNEKVEALLQKLAECNTRYADLVPDYEQAKERIRELEKQLEDLQRKLQDQEDKQKKMYLHMYTKEQEAERIARADQMLELAHRAPNPVSISDLLKQLQSTQDELENIRASNCRSQSGNSQVLLTAKEAISLWVLGARKTIYRRLLEAQENKTRVDPEVTLQFLKSAIYYFLTDKENSQGHLKAIESILEFSEQEKQNISKARSFK